MAKNVYVGVKTQMPSVKTVTITGGNISTYFTVVNSSYYFKPASTTSTVFTTTNKGVHSSTAQTTLTALMDMTNVSITYSYSSEANYDKFYFTKQTSSGTTTNIANGLSGSTTTKTWTGTINKGDILTFKYTKDNSQNRNDDQCTFSNITITVSTGTGGIKEVARKVKSIYVGVSPLDTPMNSRTYDTFLANAGNGGTGKLFTTTNGYYATGVEDMTKWTQGVPSSSQIGCFRFIPTNTSGKGSVGYSKYKVDEMGDGTTFVFRTKNHNPSTSTVKNSLNIYVNDVLKFINDIDGYRTCSLTLSENDVVKLEYVTNNPYSLTSTTAYNTTFVEIFMGAPAVARKIIAAYIGDSNNIARLCFGGSSKITKIAERTFTGTAGASGYSNSASVSSSDFVPKGIIFMRLAGGSGSYTTCQFGYYDGTTSFFGMNYPMGEFTVYTSGKYEITEDSNISGTIKMTLHTGTSSNNTFMGTYSCLMWG